MNFSSRNLLDSAAGGTFMSITLGEATKLLDNMMINYSEWHTERAPQGKKVNSVKETSSLSDKIDAIMSMLVNDRTNVDPNNVPLASLVAQEEHVDVNFIKNNNFNNNAYRNISSNNYRPYPSANGNSYGNSYGNYYKNNRSVPPGLEAMLKEFISTQTAFNKPVEEKLNKIDILASKVDRLASDVDLLKLKVMPNKDIENKIVTTANAIQVRINENIRLMAELHARWEREENEKLAKENNVAKVWTITTTSNVNAPHVAAPPTNNGEITGVGNVSTSNAKPAKLPETAKTAETACDKTAEIFSNIGDDDPIALDYNGLDFDDCHISEVIKFLQKLAKSPNASVINLAFTKHITNALIKAREEKLKLETSIPRKLDDGWEPIIKMKVNDFDCNALCDLGASISVMPKKIYDMLDLPPLKNCYLDVNLVDNATKKPLGIVDNVRITVNNNLVPVDFVVLDIECNASCPIILGRPFLRTVGAIIDMKEGMSMTYTRWTRHGEGFSDDEGRDRNDDGAYDSDNDEEEDNGDCYVDDSSSMIDELQKSGNKGPDLPNLNKDTVSARIDLKKFKMWKKYWLKKIVKDDDDAAVTYAKPPAPWTLSKEQKRHLCRYLANTRFPDGYCANWGRCVNIDGCKVTGMKTHDCHILLQRVLPAGLKGIASKEMYVAIAELGRFFRELCAKTLKVDVLNRLKVEIVVILCKLEKLFPPAFFDVMVHLAIHLPEEALSRGPVHYGWMYPVERRLGYLKSTVRNKARPEGSIAESYIVDECLIFCSRFFKDGTETRFNKDDRNQDIRRKPDPDEMEVFSVGAKGLGKSILKHFDKEFDKMVWYVLNNCDDVERYINEFRQELGGRGVRDIEETVQREFAGWFANHVRQLDNASEDLKSLAAGPDRRVVVYAGCNVKGARFRTLTRDKDLKTQNSGVATKGSFGDADETDYYGVLQEVLELQYGTNKHGDRSVYLFRCDWFDLAGKGSKIKDDGYFKSVNTSILWFKNSPFILASQAETCFYLEDTKFGDPWKVVQKFSHRHVYDVPELEDGNDDAFVRNEDAYQEDEGSVDHTFHDVVDLDEEAEVEAEEDDHRAAEVVRIHDARTIRELENGEDSPNVDMDMSEDELENQEDSLILEENIHDDEGKNSEEDSDLD
ncbi:hypothetical protein QYE76_051381 [Lolium multiflorum]|uniref:Uncharacterized protein n=1 Tax=Lolium multiflorum TaxID=4521 RepID=A0AAD8SRS6_LOLMU|nr:hypothetical protein QYE76_051381 [Lolium multiflorum]